jgi:nucleotide-binding universal stress UspA family protein
MYDVVEEEHAEELLKQARDEAGVEADTRRRAASTVGRGLHELAEKVGADLLVIGSSRRGLLGRVLIGDDTRAALNGSPCAVAVAPAGYAGRPVVLREIGVGYDGSPESKHALGLARTLAAEEGTKLSAFEAVFFPARTYAAPAFPNQADIEELVDHAYERVAALEGVEPHAAYGEPAEELAVYSASLDLLVIGSRSYGPIGRLVHGSTAQKLARTARCPLLVLTRATRKADATAVSDGGDEARTVGAIT